MKKIPNLKLSKKNSIRLPEIIKIPERSEKSSSFSIFSGMSLPN